MIVQWELLMRLKMESSIIKKVESKGIVISEIPPKNITLETNRKVRNVTSKNPA